MQAKGESQGPLVTIGIPLYNDAAYARRTIDSALAQSYQNIEIIVSDNHSSDETYEVLKSLYGLVTNVKVFRQPRNIGPNANFEFVMHAAQGEFFMWLGGHDTIHPEYVGDAVNEHLKHPDSSLVYFNHQFVDSNGEAIVTPELADISSQFVNADERAFKVFCSLNYCTHIHGLWRTKFRKAIKFPYNFGPDHLVLFVLASLGCIYKLNYPWYYRTVNRIEESYAEALKRYKSYGYKGDVNDVFFTILKVHLNYCLRNFRLRLFLRLARSEKHRFKRYAKGFYFLR